MAADLGPSTLIVTVNLRSYGTPEETATRVRDTLETHPTLSLRVDAVTAIAAIGDGFGVALCVPESTDGG